jgi:hypothetical protein
MLQLGTRVGMQEQVDICVHPPHPHPLDPYTGKIITRREGTSVEIVQADQYVILACEFLWDIVANYGVFKQWVDFAPPVKKLDIKSNFNMGPGFHIMMLPNIPTNRNERQALCQHWYLIFKVGSRRIRYQIGAYRPSINAMEASLAP